MAPKQLAISQGVPQPEPTPECHDQLLTPPTTPTLSKVSIPTLPAPPLENQSQPEHEDGRAKNQDARFAVAHARPIRGSVLIPYCILKKRPYLQRLLEPRNSSRAGFSARHKIELQALLNPVAPTNKETTRELDLDAITNNLPLRIDLNYDDQLFFQPIQGKRAADKQIRARVFWDTLCLELQTDNHNLHDVCAECKSRATGSQPHGIEIPSRTAEFLSALRDLVEMLVPEKDKEAILANLEVDDRVRMIRVGKFDAVAFSTWLADLLMTHCAPLRDSMALDMQKKISEGFKKGDMDLLVSGLQKLMALLENMKLDVANHQVRTFKSLLVADTVPFLKDCFSKMQSKNQLDLKASYQWFRSVQAQFVGQKLSDFDMFVTGTVRLCRSPCETASDLATFSYDKERLQNLRSEVLDLTQLRICMTFFHEYVRQRQGHYPTAAQSSEVSDRLIKLISTEDGQSEGVNCHIEDIATEVARAGAGSSNNLPCGSSSAAHDIDLEQITESLRERLSKKQSQIMNSVLEELTERSLHHALEFLKLSTQQVADAQRVWTTKRSAERFVATPEIEDIARRIAHIAVIHWPVWSEIVYLRVEEPDVDIS